MIHRVDSLDEAVDVPIGGTLGQLVVRIFYLFRNSIGTFKMLIGLWYAKSALRRRPC